MSEERDNQYRFEQERRNLEQLEMELEASCETTSSERLAKLAEKNRELALLVAKNFATPAPILEKLSRKAYPLICEAIAQNPNTPAKVLLELGEQFPQVLLDNPVFPLLWLEDVNLIEKIPLETLAQLFKLPKGREILLDSAANSSSFSIRYYAARTLENSHFARHNLERFADSPYEDICLAIVSNPETSCAILERLADHSSRAVRVRLAQHPNVSVLLLEKLARDLDFTVRAAAARNTRVPISILEELATDREMPVRYAVASNPQTPIYTLDRCSEDADLNVVAGVARNPNISLQFLEELSRHPDIMIQIAATGNPRMSASIFQRMVNHEVQEFREKIALAIQSVEIAELLVRESETSVRRLLAENPQISSSILEKLAKDKALEVRVNVAKHPHTPTATLAILARDPQLKVRSEVAKNVKTDLSVLKRLTKDKKELIRAEAKENLRKRQVCDP